MGWQMVDDLTGVPISADDEDGGTVTVVVDGDAFEIDLCGDGKQALDEALRPYRDAGRPVEKPRPAKRATPTASATRTAPGAPVVTKPTADAEPSQAAIREWATARGIPVNAKGSIQREVREQYLVATQGEATALSEAEHMLSVGHATMATIAAATGLTVQQVRDLNAQMQAGAEVSA